MTFSFKPFGPSYKPFGPSYSTNLYSILRTLRHEDPVHYVEEDDVWVVTRYADVTRVLREHENFSSAGWNALFAGESLGTKRLTATTTQPEGGFSSLDFENLKFILALDPPAHTQLRRLANKTFTPRRVRVMEESIRSICEDLMAKFVTDSQAGNADIMQNLAHPLPMLVIANILGIPTNRYNDFRRWVDDTKKVLLGIGMDATSIASFQEMYGFLSELTTKRRENPGNDVISLLVSGEDKDQLSHEDVVMFAIILLVAGSETTTSLLANAAAAFMAFPEQGNRVWKDPGLLPDALEEVLRWDSPVQTAPRKTTQEVVLAGKKIPEGAHVVAFIGSANRDETVFPDPDRFDIDRRPEQHIAFGVGAHYCLGAPLARLEAKMAFETFIKQTAGLRPTKDGTRIPGSVFRGWTSLPCEAGEFAITPARP